MGVYKVSRTVRNSIFEIIESNRLDPNDFEWSPHHLKPNGTEGGEKLLHRPTESYLTVEYGGSLLFWCTWSPPMPDGNRMTPVANEGAFVQLARVWIERVRREHEAPELWAQLRAETTTLTGTIDHGDQKFSASERDRIGQGLNALEAKVLALAGDSISRDQRDHLHGLMTDAKEASERLSKKDWKVFFLGLTANVLMSLAFEPSKARELIHFIAITFGPLISNVSHLIGLP